MKVIITGATGMVGEGVLMECLSNPLVTEILSVSRKTCGISHPKLKEYLVTDFLQLKENDEILKGYDTCLYCAGVSSVGMNESDYTKLTYTTTLTFAKALSPMSEMTFTYISGYGTDSSENGKSMWARVKGKTENDLQKLPFKHVFAFRPTLLKFTKGQTTVRSFYKILNGMYPFVKTFFPNMASSISELGKAMIFVSQNGYEKKVLEVKDINIVSCQKI